MSIDLAGYFFPGLFSLLFILAYCGIFRFAKVGPRFIEIAIGVSVVSAAAIILEPYLFNYIGTLLGLVVIAPILEEILKFIGTARKRDTRSGIAVGLGFALTENVLYFHSFLAGYSVSSVLTTTFLSSQIFLFIIMRGAFDPLLHSTLSGLSVRTWQKGRRLWLLVAICFHIAYNVVAVIGLTNISILAVLDAAILGSALFILFRKSRAIVEANPTGSVMDLNPEPIAVKPVTVVHIEKLKANNLAAWVRSTSRNMGFRGMAKTIGLDITERYERTMWIRKSILVAEGRKKTYTEIGPFGALLVAGLVALSSYAIWVLFG